MPRLLPFLLPVRVPPPASSPDQRLPQPRLERLELPAARPAESDARGRAGPRSGPCRGLDPVPARDRPGDAELVLAAVDT